MKYSADYKCTKCGAVKTMTAAAADFHNALTKLPRWIWPDNHKMRRDGSPTIGDKNV